MTKPPKRSKPSAHDAAPGDSEPQGQLSADAEISSETGDQLDAANPVEVEPERATTVTRELPSALAPVTGPLAGLSEDDGDETLIHPIPRPRPRRTTLAMAITQPPSSATPPPTPDGRSESVESPAPTPALPSSGIPDELVDEIDEWSIADQPTVYLAPRLMSWPRGRTRPSTPPPGTLAPPAAPPTLRSSPPAPPAAPGRDRQASVTRRLPPPSSSFSSSSGTSSRHPTADTPPPVDRPRPQRAPLRDPHMERFQYLREERIAHRDGLRGPGDGRPIADMVRQWWHDLQPVLNSALNYQREARASGSHPIPAYVPSPGSRLGDAFGRLAASARGMTGRAQSAMAPRITRLQELHAQAESAASALVEKLEFPEARQQAPLLGPGRIAVFFKQGVTIGQAQSLLGASRARPIRLIPRKHGFLTLVAPGTEAEISARLREHPYVRDVAYLEYNEYGEAIVPR